jgi:hypothetical protein
MNCVGREKGIGRSIATAEFLACPAPARSRADGFSVN